MKKKVYLDNAATTPMLPEVVKKMSENLQNDFGNPSSTHQFGRASKAIIEGVRKEIAGYLNVPSSTIVFTSGGTEANNFILQNAVENMGVTHIITSKIEHHAVLYVAQALEKNHNIKLSYVKLDTFGGVDINDLEKLLSDHQNEKILVSLMMINNEIGNLLPLEKNSAICQKYGALFHSDTVQGVGHYDINLEETPMDFISASAHKFHGPKGVGFAYFKKGLTMRANILGGGQEKGLRAGTENLSGIVGMGTALKICLSHLSEQTKYVQSLKDICMKKLSDAFEGVKFNGYTDPAKNSPFVLSVSLPKEAPMLLFQLDMEGVMVSGGSACQSGSGKGSHVLAELPKNDTPHTNMRVSFSKLNTAEDIDALVATLQKFIV